VKRKAIEERDREMKANLVIEKKKAYIRPEL
jgi:hypothetical protein